MSCQIIQAFRCSRLLTDLRGSEWVEGIYIDTMDLSLLSSVYCVLLISNPKTHSLKGSSSAWEDIWLLYALTSSYLCISLALVFQPWLGDLLNTVVLE